MAHAPQRDKKNVVHSPDAPKVAPRVVSEDEWLAARRECLALEKDVTRAYDALIEKRRSLPYVKVRDDYSFVDAETGDKATLRDLVEKAHKDGGKPLVVQHFMWPVGWDSACGNCSLWQDGISGVAPQLSTACHVVVSINHDKLEDIRDLAAKKAWAWPVLSCHGSTYHVDSGVSQTAADSEAKKPMSYNFSEPRPNPFGGLTELPGFTVYAMHDDAVCKVNAVFARGLEPLCAYWAVRDLLPGGRQGQYGVPHKEDVKEDNGRRRRPKRDRDAPAE